MDYRYNPGFSSDEVLIETFVVRQPFLEMILETIRQNTATANQHVLVVGARGTGKTMLVRRVAAAIRKNPDLDAWWYPLVFGEESYQISNVGEFWLEALFHVADRTEEAKWQRVYAELAAEPDNQRLKQRALAQLMDFADSLGKRILLIVENLNMLFAEQMDEHDDWELRHTLQNEPRLMLLGTATQRFNQIEGIDRAWFEFFVTHQLEALSLEECQALWAGITDKSVHDNRLKPIKILTGGNPRLMKILIDFADDLSLQDLMENLTQLIDEHTDYFKSHLEYLAATERKVFVALLELWDPTGAKEIATVARMGVSQVSSLLNRLVNRGAVTAVQTKGRKKLYQAAERLYNIYYLMRRRSHPASRVQAAVKFMVNFYQGDELVDVMTRLVNEACLLSPQERADHFHAFEGVLKATQQLKIRGKLLAAAPESFLGAPDAPESLRKFLSGLEKELVQDVYLEFLKGAELFELGCYEEAITVCDDIITRVEKHSEPELLKLIAWALFNKVYCLGNLGLSEETIAVYDDLITRFENRSEPELLRQVAKALLFKSVTAGSLKRSEEVITICGDLINRFENRSDPKLLEAVAKALFYKGYTLGSLERFEEAIEVYDNLITHFENRPESELLEEVAQALFYKGTTLGAQERFEEGIAVYNNLITRFENRSEPKFLDQVARALNDKGYSLMLMNRWEEAELPIKRSLTLRPDNLDTNHSLAELLLYQQKWDELWDRVTTLLSLSTTHEIEDREKEEIINLLIKIAAVGHAAKVLQILRESESAAQLEPLMVGLQIFLGEEPLVAQEILEIGQDVAQRIRQLQELSPSPSPNVQ